LSGFAAAANVTGTSFKLINVLDPTLAQDAATKNYVDTALNSSNDLAIANFVGNTGGKADSTIIRAVTIDNTGLVAIVDDAVTTAKILDNTILAADIAML
jgi:hypothetical protein